MGKVISNTCEFCYLNRISVSCVLYTEANVRKFKVIADLTFELRDAQKNMIMPYFSQVVLQDGLTAMPTSRQITALLASKQSVLDAAIAATKLAEAGFVVTP